MSIVSGCSASALNTALRALFRALNLASFLFKAYIFSERTHPGKISLYAGGTARTCSDGALMREKGKSTRCARVVTPVAMMLYGALVKLEGNFILAPNPKNVPSPHRISWSGALDVWLEP